MQYYKDPDVPPVKPYNRRWPAPPQVQAPPPKQPMTCDPAEGASLLFELKKLFPTAISSAPKKETSAAAGGNGEVVVVKTQTITNSSSDTPPTFKNEGLKTIFELAVKFKDNIKKDTGETKVTPVNTSKMTKDEYTKYRQNLMKEALLKRIRANCYSKLRQYLDDSYQPSVIGGKCTETGKMLKRCLTYIS